MLFLSSLVVQVQKIGELAIEKKQEKIELTLKRFIASTGGIYAALCINATAGSLPDLDTYECVEYFGHYFTSHSYVGGEIIVSVYNNGGRVSDVPVTLTLSNRNFAWNSAGVQELSQKSGVDGPINASFSASDLQNYDPLTDAEGLKINVVIDTECSLSIDLF